MIDLAQRLRDVVDSASPITLEEVQDRPLSARQNARHRPRLIASAAVVGLVAVGLLIAAVTGVFAPTSSTRVTVGGGSSVSTSATADGVTVRLTLEESSVPAGGTVHGHLTVKTSKPIVGCPHFWYEVGFTSSRTGQLGLDTLPDCGNTTAIPAGTSSYQFKQTARYKVCTNNPTQVQPFDPRCTTRGIPDLPSGLYQFRVMPFITDLPTPTAIPLTVTSP
jgi:hypothetical protein